MLLGQRHQLKWATVVCGRPADDRAPVHEQDERRRFYLQSPRQKGSVVDTVVAASQIRGGRLFVPQQVEHLLVTGVLLGLQIDLENGHMGVAVVRSIEQ